MRNVARCRQGLVLWLAALSFVAPTSAVGQECADYSASEFWLGEKHFDGFDDWVGAPKALSARGDTLVTFDGGTLFVMDATDPGNIQPLCRWPVHDAKLSGADIALRGDYVYGAAWDSIGVVSIADPTSPQCVGSFPSLLPWANVAMCVSGDLLLQVADDGLQLVDISQPDHPVARAVVPTVDTALDVACCGSLALLATGAGLVFIDCSLPDEPAIIGQMTELGSVRAVAIEGSRAYASASAEPGGLKIIDITDPLAPRIEGQVAGAGGYEIAVGNGFACVSAYGLGFMMCDVSDSAHPRLVRRIQPCPLDFGGILIRHGCAYAVQCGDPAYQSSLKVIRLSRQDAVVPASCELWTDNGSPFVSDLAAFGGHAYAALELGSYTPNILRIVDISNPATPTAVAQLQVPARRLLVSDHYLFAVGHSFEVFDIATPAQPAPIASLPLGVASSYYLQRVQQLGHLVLIQFDPPYQQPAVSLLVDVADPAAPEIAGFLPAESAGKCLIVSGDIACGAAGDSLFVFDVADRFHPHLLGAVQFGSYCSFHGPDMVGRCAYLMADTPALDHRLLVFDLTDPSRPTLVTTLPLPCSRHEMRIVGNTAYVVDYSNGIHLLDVTDPRAPVYGGTVSWDVGHSCIEVAGDRLLTCFWNDFNVFPLDCASAVPVFLASFEVEPRDGAVELAWSVAGDERCEFRLRGQRDGASWPLAFAMQTGGTYFARDVSPGLAAGGLVAYTLEYRDSGHASWTSLGSRTVALSGPRQPVMLTDPSPNPFNPAVAVEFVLDAPQHATLTIYDLGGRRVIELVDGAFPAGRHETIWRGVDAYGAPVASGIYVLRVAGERGSDQRKITLLR